MSIIRIFMDSSKKHELCKEMCNTIDMICRIKTRKSLPHVILRDIYYKLYRSEKKYKKKKCTLEEDFNLMSRGNVKKKWKNINYETGLTKFRIRRAFNYGR